MGCQIGVLPCTPFASSSVPLKGKREVWRGKTESYYISCTIPQFPPFGGERSEPIISMRIMPYDTESQSRNADFISIARRAIP